ncbi:MAG: hypothetical protein EZS28_020093 [Streblomastix strix]|uniref:Tyr recombinase domain-containing protein n=1 Tax=Streblomastix strix TaxID=222440 RepID=A0A5J4VPB9_9EUKA|nr:MAG: hypothetical protein EZS28_020093 [Streblomastix strix]
MGIKGKKVYSFRYSAATQLVLMGLDETLLNTYTGHARNSKATNDYNVFAERLKDNEIATKLSDTRGQVEYNPISIGLLVIRGCIIIYNNFALVPFINVIASSRISCCIGNMLLIVTGTSYLQLSPQETLAPPLYFEIAKQAAVTG